MEPNEPETHAYVADGFGNGRTWTSNFERFRCELAKLHCSLTISSDAIPIHHGKA